MKIEIDDEYADQIIKKQCEEWIEYYTTEIDLVNQVIKGKDIDRIPVKYKDPKKDLKYLKKQRKAWKRALDDYAFMDYFYDN